MSISIDSYLSQIVAGQPRKPSPIKNALEAIRDWINGGSIVNADINGSAAIDPSKIDFGDTGAQSTLGYAQAVTNQGSITSEADLTSLSVTVTVPSGGRRIRITGFAIFAINAANNVLTFKIKESTTVLNTVLQNFPTANLEGLVICQYVAVPIAGSHTYKLTAERTTGAGTATLSASATQIAFIHVEMV